MSTSDEVKQRIDAVELISRYTPLKRAGANYTGICPFHSERTPSFVVFPSSGTWHCFGACGTGGDIFSFIMKKENLDFREALQMLAREAGVELTDSAGNQTQRQRAAIYDVNEAAAAFFQEVLHSHPSAQVARAYLQRRGVDEATAARFRLGFALDQWNALRDYLSGQGFATEQMVEAALVKQHEERETLYDAFRGRLMIPIRDRQGRIIGFGGRVLDGSQPKYLNTAETAIFHKSHVVYGLDQAHQAIRDQNQVVIAEGYMDVIAAHQFGYRNVVACMGTALTPEQLQQLQRYTSNFVLALDADAAGQAATMRGLNQARQALTRVRKPTVTSVGLRFEERLGAQLLIVSMPEGRDPDDVIRANPAEWATLIQTAKPLVDYYFQVVAHQVDLGTAQGKAFAVTELAPLIAELDDEIEREHYVQQLSRLVQLDERTIAGRVQAAARTSQVIGNQPRPARESGRFGIKKRPGSSIEEDGYASSSDEGYDSQPPPEMEAPPRIAAAPSTAKRVVRRPDALDPEEYLLAHLLMEPDLLVWLTTATLGREIAPPQAQDWQHVENQEIFRALKLFLSRDEQWDMEMFQETVDGSLHGRLAQLLSIGMQLPPRPSEEVRLDLVKVLVRLRLLQLKGSHMRIRYLIDEAQSTGDQETMRSYHMVNNRNLRELSHLERTWAELSKVLFAQGRSQQGVKIGYEK
jgi:DNA primase